MQSKSPTANCKLSASSTEEAELHFQIPKVQSTATIHPRCSMYGICTCILASFEVHVGKHSIHGAIHLGINFMLSLCDMSGEWEFQSAASLFRLTLRHPEKTMKMLSFCSNHCCYKPPIRCLSVSGSDKGYGLAIQ